MDKRTVFKILGIEETKDENILKDAYRRKLLVTNPEDDPEGFKALRAAYEEAIRLASEVESEDNSPVGLWTKQLSQIYDNFETRLSVDSFKELFEQDIAVAFDTADDIREALLVFLMNKNYLPTEVWKLIGKKYDIESAKEELCEKFPKNYIDFIISMSKLGNFIDFDLFENVWDSDVDAFINNLYDFKGAVDNNDIELAESLLKKFEDEEIYHPYIDVEKLKLAGLKNDKPTIQKIVDKLLKRDYKNEYILSNIAGAQYTLEDIENAIINAKKVLETMPKHYEATRILADALLYKKDYHGAKKLYEKLLTISNYDERVITNLDVVNNNLIEEYEQKLKQEPNNATLALDLGWCYYEKKNNERACEIVENIVPLTEDEKYDYPNLLGRLYSISGKNQKAIELLTKWYNNILALPNSEDEITTKRRVRKGYAILFLSSTYRNMADEDLKNREQHLEKALYYTNQKLDSDDLAITEVAHEKASVLKKLGRFEQCVECCDKIIESDRGYFPAYAIRQEAFYRMGRGQEVIDNFYQIINILKEFTPCYVLAVKTYIKFNMHDKVKEIIDLADKNGLSESNDIKFCKIMQKMSIKKNVDEGARAGVGEYRKIIQSAKEGNPVFYISDIYYQIFSLERYIGESNAINSINKAIKEAPAEYRYYKEKLKYLISNNRRLALEFVDELMEIFGEENSEILYLAGYTYKECLMPEKAIKMLEKCVAKNTNNMDAYFLLMNSHEDLYRDKRNAENIKRALECADVQIKYFNDSRVYINKGLLYMMDNDIYKARENFEAALKCGNDDAFSNYFLANTYKIEGNFEKARELYITAIEQHEEKNPYYMLKALATCYECLCQYNKAEETLNRILEVYPKDEVILKELTRVYIKMKNWQAGIDTAKKAKAIAGPEDYDIREKMAICYGELKKFVKAKSICRGPLLEGKDLWYRAPKLYDLRLLMDFDFYVRNNKRKAKLNYKLEDGQYASQDLLEYLETYIAICYYRGKTNNIDKIFKQIKELYNEVYGGVEQYLKPKDIRRARLFTWGKTLFYAGKLEQAKKIFEELFNERNCCFCQYGKCVEVIVAEGLLLEAEGKYKEAIEKYKTVVEEGFDINIYKGIIRILSEKVKK